jgi:hypothetical protein
MIVTHGLRRHKFYSRACSIWHRCNNPKREDYAYYGAKGITCPKTIGDVILLLDKIPNYFDGAEIDRINPDGNYEEGNLRWATELEQSTNRGTYSNNTSGYKGVKYNKECKTWVASIDVKGKRYTEPFKTKDEAIAKRLEYERMRDNGQL